jgi:lysozyme family protein
MESAPERVGGVRGGIFKGSKTMRLARREFLAASVMSAGSAAVGAGARAQPASNDTLTSGFGPGKEFEGILAEAGQLQMPIPQAAGPYNRSSPLDLADLIDQALSRGPDDEDALNLARRGGLLLSELTRDQRDGLEILPSDPVPAAPPPFTYNDTMARDYGKLFRELRINTSATNELNRVARFVTSARAKEQYQQVETDTHVPWYIVGALHYREANLNFMGHLHNGDPLLMQTVHVPAKRPPRPWPPADVSDPAQLWRLSAKDALDRLSRMIPTWTVERMCFGLEAYNGFGCRLHGIKSPYLWNYTDAYTEGGFPRDHEFDPHYRSKQAGLVTIIKKLNEIDPVDVELTFET